MLGTLGMQEGPLKSHFFGDFCCYLNNFLLWLSPSPLRVYPPKTMLLGPSPGPWVTPPLRVLGQMVRAPLYYSGWKCQALTPLNSNDVPGLTAHLSSGCRGDSHTIISISISFFHTIYHSLQEPSLFLKLELSLMLSPHPQILQTNKSLSRCISTL